MLHPLQILLLDLYELGHPPQFVSSGLFPAHCSKIGLAYLNKQLSIYNTMRRLSRPNSALIKFHRGLKINSGFMSSFVILECMAKSLQGACISVWGICS